MPYLSLLRLKNCGIIIATQLIFYYHLIIPVLNRLGLQATLSSFQVILFVICTALLAASANVINDVFDQETDKINKSEQNVVGAQITAQQAKYYYYSLVLIGFIIALYLALTINKFHLVLIYPMATTLLYLYSRSFKRIPLVGNLVVAGFTAFVTGVLLIAEPILLYNMNPKLHIVFGLILAFSAFAFLINLAREIIKDIEDMDGDKITQTSTLPLKYGVAKSKKVIFFVNFCLIFGIVIWILLSPEIHDYRAVAFGLVIIVGLLLYGSSKLMKAIEKFHYTKLSLLYKYIMLAGLLYCLLLIQNFHSL